HRYGGHARGTHFGVARPQRPDGRGHGPRTSSIPGMRASHGTPLDVNHRAILNAAGNRAQLAGPRVQQGSPIVAIGSRLISGADGRVHGPQVAISGDPRNSAGVGSLAFDPLELPFLIEAGPEGDEWN